MRVNINFFYKRRSKSMSIKHRTNAESVLAALKLTGMAAALSFIMMLVLAGCPVEPDPESLASVTFAAGSNLSSGSFSGLSGFRSDLYSKYFAEGGGAGRYTRSSAGSTWTKL
jgi:hypothetical protein